MEFRADHVGSLLRPRSVPDAGRRLAAGQIDAGEQSAKLRLVADVARTVWGTR